jgi:hypothetical protein
MSTVTIAATAAASPTVRKGFRAWFHNKWHDKDVDLKKTIL